MSHQAWLLYGPPGCGKSTWIQKQAKVSKKQLYHWNARADRTLREGRETLHQQVRSQNPLFVWIEGADDLTPEAQAFLRRILETASKQVQCILECRDPSRISPAIQSRCEWKQCVNQTSFRKQEQKGLVVCAGKEEATDHTSFGDLHRQAENPILHIQKFLEDPVLWKQAILSLRAVGSGSSAWSQLAYLKSLRGAGAGTASNSALSTRS